MFANFTAENCTGVNDTLTLTGAKAGHIVFSESFADGDLVSYALEDGLGIIKVAGIGTYNSTGNTITRNDSWNWNGVAVDKNPATNIPLSGGGHAIRCDLVDKRLETGGVRSGKIYVPSIFTELTSVQGAGSNSISYSPVIIDYAGYYDSFAFQVAGASGTGNAILGLYTSKDGMPNKLIASHITNISTTTTGLKVATFDEGSIFLEKGSYYGAINHTDSATYTSAQIDSVTSNQLGSDGINSIIAYIYKARAYSIPDPADIASVSNQTGRCPIIGVIAT